jgi:hypothetical protein
VVFDLISTQWDAFGQRQITFQVWDTGLEDIFSPAGPPVKFFKLAFSPMAGG